jgi:hypothetical protein
VEEFYVAQDHSGEAIFAFAQREHHSGAARFCVAVG